MSIADEQTTFSFSEDDGPGEPGPSNRTQSTKRGTRACDRCRKIKSKCEPGAGEKCKNCELANTPCTFQGPSFKRGPPKGYIHSIEQRWHQVECILATIMESPRAQDIVHDLRGDPFANSILDRVQTGPYGARGRLESNTDTTSDRFYASLVQVPEHAPARDDRRSRRQSRVSREIVSQDPTALATPTREWQEQLSRRLTYGNQLTTASTSLSPISRPSSSTGSSNEYARARRRLDYGPRYSGQSGHAPAIPQSWDNLYTLPDTQAGEPNTMDDTAEVFGHLSVDDNKEFRYHGSASGLPLLAQSRRKTGDGLQEHRIWKFGASHLNPEIDARDSINEEEDVAVNLPSQDRQHHLLQLYFTYVHPFFPIIHKQDFLYHYHAFSSESAPQAVGKSTQLSRHPMQRPCKLLLLCMFAIAARYSDRPEDHPGQEEGHASRAGQQFAEDAHKLLDRKYQTSRPSTCQALLLLAIREFGMSAMDEGWLYSGMALRMAIDLGMNRNADNWTTDGTTPVFTDAEKQIRKHIWWSCCICDKLSAVWLGRPITFRANDYSTPVPDINEPDEEEPWQPYPPESWGHDFAPQPARLMSTFQAACHLSVIITDVMDKIYPVQPSSDTPRSFLFEQLETRLAKWLISLPEHLRYSSNDKNANPLPHILMLHIEYQAAVLLLHRAFLPPHSEGPTNPTLRHDQLALKAFDVCTAAATQITSMAEIYNDKFGLDKAPPFLSIYLQSAGIMHAITLTRRPWDPQATLGLTRCISACKRMETLWPTTTRLRLLLEGVKVRLDESTYAYEGHASSHKRSVEDALGSSQNPDLAARDMYGLPPMDQYHSPPSVSRAWDYGANARAIAHTLGTGMASGEQSSFYPGYQWWPSQLMTTEGLTHMSLSAPMDIPPVSAPMVYATMAGPSMATPAHHHHHHHQLERPQVPVSQPHQPHVQHAQQQQNQGAFTFDQSHMSPDFGQGVEGLSYPGYQYRYPTPGNQGPSHQPHQ
ncbi:fungal-specific transcription factor domain-containing protein [Trametes meyenii]|nr:fungal-specific transcription factor domain-containing protein [Trametes meyenii]